MTASSAWRSTTRSAATRCGATVTPVTTKDVLFTWQIGRIEEAGINSQELYRRMENVVAHDDKRFTIQWNKRTCDAEAINDFEIVPAHLETAAAADPTQYRSRNAYDTNPTNAGLYFGPYRISRVEPGASVTLEPNPTWWGQKPQFKRIVVRTIENTAALEANLLSGEIDYIAGEDGISLDQALEFEKRHGNDYNVVFKPGLFYEHIDLMLDNPILKDIRVAPGLAPCHRSGSHQRSPVRRQAARRSHIHAPPRQRTHRRCSQICVSIRRAHANCSTKPDGPTCAMAYAIMRQENRCASR